MKCPLCRSKIDYYTDDIDAQKIINKCKIEIGGFAIDTEIFLKCHRNRTIFLGDTLIFYLSSIVIRAE